MNNNAIVFISNFLGNGGAARVICVLAEELAKRGYEVTVLSFPFHEAEYKLNAGVKQIVLGNTRHLNVMQRIRLIRKELKRNTAATVIAFEYFVNMQTILAGIGLKKKIIISERNDPAVVGGTFPRSVIRNMLYQFCHTLVCQTPDAKAYFPSGIQRKTKVIANPVKADLPDPWQKERSHYIVNFCRLVKQKNLKLLIDAFAEFHQSHPDYKLLIYGNGPQRDALIEYVNSCNLASEVQLYNAIENVHEKILDATMFVSSSDYEGLSNSMLEAMAMGLPVICTDCPCGGARMVIDHGTNGILVPVNNKAAMVEAMIRVADDKEFANSLGGNAVHIRETLSVSNITSEWESVIKG